MLIVKKRLNDLKNFIENKNYTEALKLLLAYENLLFNFKKKDYIKNIIKFLDDKNVIEKFLKIYLNYYIHLDKYKFFEQLLKLNMWEFLNSEKYVFFLNKIFSQIYKKSDVSKLLNQIFSLEDDDIIQKNKYFFLFILFHNFENSKLWFENLKLFKKHQEELINLDKEELLLTFNTYANHIFLNFSQTQDEFDIICEAFDKTLSNYLLKKYRIQSNNKKYNSKKDKLKIAFIVDKVVNNSPNQILYAFLKTFMELYNKKVEIYLIDANQQERVESKKEVVKRFKEIGIKYINLKEFTKSEDSEYNNHIMYSRKLRCEGAYNFIKKENIDIIIFGNSLYLSIYLAARRAAPIQIYWSHGNANWNVNGIDIRISHFPQNSKYIYFIFEEPRLKEFYIGPNPKLEKEIAKHIRKSLEKKYGKDIVILGTIGRAIKLQSEEYIKLICDVMKKHKNTIYLACGRGCDIVKDLILKYGGEEVLSRWIFPGQVNPYIYGWVIDIWPDTFPLNQGKSKNEFECKKGCTVIYVKDSKGINYFYQSKINLLLNKLGIINFNKILDRIRPLNNINDYKTKLEKFISDENFRKETLKLVTKYHNILFSKSYRKIIINDFYKFLCKLENLKTRI